MTSSGELAHVVGAASRKRVNNVTGHSTAVLPETICFSPRMISLEVFHNFRDLIHREAGIWLSDAKIALLIGRLSKRLRLLGLNNLTEYFSVVSVDPQERIQMLDAIATNETHFFREPAHFQFLQGVVFPKWQADAAAGRRGSHIRVWSAGCSTGQEPYSLAMALLNCFSRAAGWSIEIIGTELSVGALSAAEAGIWDAEKIREIPPHYLGAFMLKGRNGQQGRIKAGPKIRSIVRFSRLNLNDQSYPLRGSFDLIFCRNVLIYFDLETRARITGQLLRYLAPGGYFFLGHAEGLHSRHEGLRSVLPTVYVSTETGHKERDDHAE